jgi:ribose-phosphate pyrophosphokinase
MKSELKIFSGNGNPRLSKSICEYLRVPLGRWDVTSFADGEIYVQINENVRGTDVFLIQPTCTRPPSRGSSIFRWTTSSRRP